MHQLFASMFPEVGDKETRVIHIIGPETGIPPGTYPILEFYCVDDNCDCRQVYLRVMKDGVSDIDNCEADISFGWEPRSFYVKWFGKEDVSLDDFKGPSLNKLVKQGAYKAHWLKLIRNLLKTDKRYAKRLEAHYKMTKQMTSAKI